MIQHLDPIHGGECGPYISFAQSTSLVVLINAFAHCEELINNNKIVNIGNEGHMKFSFFW